MAGHLLKCPITFRMAPQPKLEGPNATGVCYIRPKRRLSCRPKVIPKLEIMKNVVLLQPRLGDMDAFRDRPTPPLALLAAVAGIEGEMDIRLIDQRIDRDWPARVAEAIDEDTVAAGVTALTGGMITHGLELSRHVRSLRPIPIVWGGVHASLLPEQTVSHKLVDFVVEGEGEIAFAALLRDLASGGKGGGIPGVWRKQEGVVDGIPRAGMLDMAELPPLPWHRVDMNRYLGMYRDKPQLFYQSSRGCPFRCAYCYNTVYNGRKWRSMDADRVLAELTELRSRLEFKSVYFLDDDFFIDLPRAMKILKGMHAMGLSSILQGVDIHTMSRFSDQDLDFLEENGVERISIGVESGTDRVRNDLLHKWGSIDVIRREFRRLANRRFLVLCTFIVGFPGETPAETQATIDLVLWTLGTGANFRVPQLYNFTPYPGTELHQMLVSQGFSFPTTLDAWGMFEWDRNMLHDDSPGLRERLENLVFLSKFLDHKADDYGFGGAVLRLGYNAYRPLARARLRSGLISPLPERLIYDALRVRLTGSK